MGKPSTSPATQTLTIINNNISASEFSKLKLQQRSGREEDEETKGIRVFDPGFTNTSVVRSKITFIDGDAGILRYRGFAIEELAEKSTFLESAYLLLYGELPTRVQKAFFETEVLHHTFIHSDMEAMMRSFRYDAHPMSMLISAFACLGSFHPEANPSLQGQKLYTSGTEEALRTMDKQIFRIIGKAPTLAAMAYRIRQGRPFNRPPIGMSYAESFLYQIDYLNERDYTPSPVLAKALDTLFLLHADHELNASAAAMLQVGSAGPDPYSAIAAACSALYGPLHGGANEAVIRMLMKIGSVENVPAFVEKVKKKEEVLSGYGHRIYKTSDPRSFIIRKTAEDVFKATGEEPLLKIAMALNDIASKDAYFIERRLYPNVDFWSGLIYRAMGFPTDFFVVLFAVPRVVGWLAHWRQMMLEGQLKIWRPRQIYIGEAARPYVPVEQRLYIAKEAKGEPTHVTHEGPTKRTRLAMEGKSKL